MKLTIEQNAPVSEVEITVRCRSMDTRLEALIRQMQMYELTIAARKDGSSYLFTLDSIFYFECVEDRTYLYLRDEVYECPKRLYELEQLLEYTSFVRVSKACMVNTAMVESVRSLFGRRLEALLDNGERIIVNRHYVPAFKEKFGLEETGI